MTTRRFDSSTINFESVTSLLVSLLTIPHHSSPSLHRQQFPKHLTIPPLPPHQKIPSLQPIAPSGTTATWGLITNAEFLRCFITSIWPPSSIVYVTGKRGNSSTPASTGLTLDFVGIEDDKFFFAASGIGGVTASYEVQVTIGWVFQVPLLVLFVAFGVWAFFVKRKLDRKNQDHGRKYDEDQAGKIYAKEMRKEEKKRASAVSSNLNV